MKDDDKSRAERHKMAGPCMDEKMERATLLASIAERLESMTPKQLMCLKKLLAAAEADKTDKNDL